MSKTKNGTIIVSIIAEGLGEKGNTKVLSEGELNTQNQGPTIDINAKTTICQKDKEGTAFTRDGVEVPINPQAMRIMEKQREVKSIRETKE